jgi:hypothetical protein
MTLEYIHVTVHHACGHDMLRAVRSDDKATLAWVADGWMKDADDCKHCVRSEKRAL